MCKFLLRLVRVSSGWYLITLHKAGGALDKETDELLNTVVLHGYLAHKKQRCPRTLQKDYSQGLEVVLGGGGRFV